MTDFTRAAWGAQPSKYELAPWGQGQPSGFCLHYEGADVDVAHDSAYWTSVVRSIQNYHMHHAKDDYSDIAYNFVVAPNGDRFEGVGWDYRSQAQNRENPLHVAICYIGGPNTELTDAAKATFTRTIAEHPVGPVVGHRDEPSCSTACPGNTIEDWIHAGLPVVDTKTLVHLLETPEMFVLTCKGQLDVVVVPEVRDAYEVAAVDDKLPHFTVEASQRAFIINSIRSKK